MSYYYQTLYSMPCRLPCQRYIDGDKIFEASVQSVPKESFDGGEYEPSISRESYTYDEGYEYEPTISGENYTRVSMSRVRPSGPPSTTNYGEYSKTVGGFQRPEQKVERYELDQAEEGAKCNCGPMNRPYRMQSCGYNQSPTWDYHRSFDNSVTLTTPTLTRPILNETFENGSECGCGPKNPPYRMESCGYNQSPTWADQAQFRNTLQNRPF